MEKGEKITGDHHRRPRSIGGTDAQSNLSSVERHLHDAWHVLVGNMNAYQTCDFLNYLPFKPKGIIIVCKFINGSKVTMKGENNFKNKAKIRKAWKILFQDWEFTEIISTINNIWLDPSYHLYIEKEKTGKE
jgi:hypothetical protein